MKKLAMEADLAATRFQARWCDSGREPSEAERAEWFAWLQTSPEHVQAAFDVESLYERVGETQFVKNFDVDAWLARGRAQVIRLPDSPTAPYSLSSKAIAVWRQVRIRALLAASVAVFSIVAVLSWKAIEQPQVYSTGIGQQLTFELADGSVLQLNTRSRARVLFDERLRAIELDGEGLFTVAHDAARPFVVRTPSATARAVGTRFNVYERGSHTTVSVVEGVVQVAAQVGETRDSSTRPIELAAGEEARVQQGVLTKVAEPNVANRVAWQNHTLVFEKVRLADVAAEFNRYNEQQFRIDPKLAGQLVSGTFDPRYPRSLVLWLQIRTGVEVRDEGNVVAVDAR